MAMSHTNSSDEDGEFQYVQVGTTPKLFDSNMWACVFMVFGPWSMCVLVSIKTQCERILRNLEIDPDGRIVASSFLQVAAP